MIIDEHHHHITLVLPNAVDNMDTAILITVGILLVIAVILAIGTYWWTQRRDTLRWAPIEMTERPDSATTALRG